MFRKLVWAFTFIVSTHSTFADAEETLHTFNVVLLQPDFVLQERVPDVPALSNYIKAIEGAASSAVQSNAEVAPTGGFIVVAVKPGEKSNIWLDFKPALQAQTAAAIQSAAKSVPPPTVEKGVVVFALKVGLWGGSAPAATAPSPAEWNAAARAAGRPIETGALVEMIWRE